LLKLYVLYYLKTERCFGIDSRLWDWLICILLHYVCIYELKHQLLLTMCMTPKWYVLSTIKFVIKILIPLTLFSSMVFLLSPLITVMGDRELITGRSNLLQDIIPHHFHTDVRTLLNSRSYFTTGGITPISSSWRRAKNFFFLSWTLAAIALYKFNILSEERMGLSFTIDAGPH
jgi:hypothetical protein